MYSTRGIRVWGRVLLSCDNHALTCNSEGCLRFAFYSRYTRSCVCSYWDVIFVFQLATPRAVSVSQSPQVMCFRLSIHTGICLFSSYIPQLSVLSLFRDTCLPEPVLMEVLCLSSRSSHLWEPSPLRMCTYCHVSEFPWLKITGSGLDIWALLLQLQSNITAHNQWLSKTRSIPYWTTSVLRMRPFESSGVLCYDRRLAGQSILE
jgi:hypothetical protein